MLECGPRITTLTYFWCDLMQNSKEAVADDILPDGTKVKEGDTVMFHAYGMGRMPYIWGPDAGDFKPDRWIKDGVFQPESHFKYIAFQVSLLVTPCSIFSRSIISIKSNNELLRDPGNDTFCPEPVICAHTFFLQVNHCLTGGSNLRIQTWEFVQGGPRLCLGKDSSYLQMKITVALLTQFFDFQLVPGHHYRYKAMISLIFDDGLPVTMHKRQS